MLCKSRRAAVGAVLALVAFASSASAECAWVLWEATSVAFVGSDGLPVHEEGRVLAQTGFGLVGASSSEAECRFILSRISKTHEGRRTIDPSEPNLSGIDPALKDVPLPSALRARGIKI